MMGAGLGNLALVFAWPGNPVSLPLSLALVLICAVRLGVAWRDLQEGRRRVAEAEAEYRRQLARSAARLGTTPAALDAVVTARHAGVRRELGHIGRADFE